MNEKLLSLSLFFSPFISLAVTQSFTPSFSNSLFRCWRVSERKMERESSQTKKKEKEKRKKRSRKRKKKRRKKKEAQGDTIKTSARIITENTFFFLPTIVFWELSFSFIRSYHFLSLFHSIFSQIHLSIITFLHEKIRLERKYQRGRKRRKKKKNEWKKLYPIFFLPLIINVFLYFLSLSHSFILFIPFYFLSLFLSFFYFYSFFSLFLFIPLSPQSEKREWKSNKALTKIIF